MKKIKLSDISVGLSDGEVESRKKNFENMFYTGNKKYEELQVRHKYLLTGRKGTGKTILAKYYILKQASLKKRHFVNYLLLDKYNSDQFIELSYSDESSKIKIFFQKYFIIKELANIIINSKCNLYHFNFNIIKYNRYKKTVLELKNHFDDIYGDGVYEVKEFLVRKKDSFDNKVNSKIISKSFSPNMSEVGLESELIKGDLKETEQQFSKLNFVSRIEPLYKKVYSCLKYVSVELVLDDFDEIDISENVTRYHYIGQFVETVKRINSELSQYGTNSRVILLLREDYITKLNSMMPNIQKTISDSLVELNWTDGSNKKDLMNMIVNKIKKSNNFLEQFSIEEVKDKFFPNYVEKEKKTYTNALEHIIDYTFYRPRDLVMYIDTIIKNYGNEFSISEEMVIKCSAEYSRKFKGEIENELSSHYLPEFQEKIFESLRIQNKQRFKSSDYIEEMVKKGIFVCDDEAKQALEVMFQFSIIGNYNIVKKKNRSGEKVSRFTFRYREPGTVLPDFSSKFQVHKGLIKALNIV